MNGAPLMVVARNLGHADTRMVEKHYGHLAPSYIADAIRAAAPRFGIADAGRVVQTDWHGLTMRPMIDGPPPTEDDDPPPTWEKLRFSADSVARCFGPEWELPLATRAKLADDINAILDRDHNRRTKVFVTLDLSRARNVSVADVRAARQRRVMDAAGALYQEIEAYQGYGPVEEPWPEIARLLATAGAIFPREYPAPRGQPRKDWHRPGAEIARLVDRTRCVLPAPARAGSLPPTRRVRRQRSVPASSTAPTGSPSARSSLPWP